MKKQNSQHPSGRKLRSLFCFGLILLLAAGVVFSSAAANLRFVQYDVAVQSSSTHTVALSGGKLYFWGTNDDGQFPGSDLIYSPEPLELLSSIKDMAVSEGRTLTVTTGGVLRSYGRDPLSGEISESSGAILAKDAVQVAASDTFAAYVSNTGALYTWGQNDCGQLGNGTGDSASQPVQILESGVKKVSLGNLFGLALMEDGSVYGWGSNSSRETGYEKNGEIVPTLLTPVLVTDHVKDISTGSTHSCILKEDGSLWTCGSNLFSQTGVAGASENGLTRILTGIRSVSAGSKHNFAVSNDGAVYTWGYALFGQLGQNSPERIEVPKETSFDYVSVFACYDNTFGVASDGSLYSFGNNTNYLLGKKDGSDSMIPMQILDKDMNWVYEDSQNSSDQESSTPPAETKPSVSHVPSGEEADPEVTVTPFISGYEDGTFRPGRNVTRAEFLRMLISAVGRDFDPEVDYNTCSFSDVSLNRWYAPYICYAEQKGYVHGYSDHTFRPDQPITRAEASIMACAVLKLDLTNVPDAGYTDVNPSSGAASAINALAANGTVGGDGNGKFRPNDNIKRCEAATMVAQAAGFRPDDSAKAALKTTFPESPFQDVSVDSWYYAYVLCGVGSAK